MQGHYCSVFCITKRRCIGQKRQQKIFFRQDTCWELMYFLAHVLQDKNGWRLGDGTVKDGTAWQGANRFWATGGQLLSPWNTAKRNGMKGVLVGLILYLKVLCILEALRLLGQEVSPAAWWAVWGLLDRAWDWLGSAFCRYFMCCRFNVRSAWIIIFFLILFIIVKFISFVHKVLWYC